MPDKYLIQSVLKGDEVAFRPDESDDTGDSLQQAEMRQLLWRGIYALDSSLREALLLFYLRRMKRLEIAELLLISEAAVRNRLHKGRKLLRKEILQMLEQNVHHPELPDHFTAQVIEEAMQRGEQYLNAKSWEKAKEAFQRAIDVVEDYAPAYRRIIIRRFSGFQPNDAPSS